MEAKRPNKENEMLKALESIQYEDLKLQKCLQEILIIKKSLESNCNSAESHLSSLIEEEHDLIALNAIYQMKIQTVEKECNQLEKMQKNLAEAIQSTNIEIKEYRKKFDSQIDNFTVDADKLCLHFLFAMNNNELAEADCLNRLDDLNKIKEEIMEKENAIFRIKKKLEEFVFYEFPENPIEFTVQREERLLIMSILEEEFLSARGQLEDLNIIKSEKEIEECEIIRNV